MQEPHLLTWSDEGGQVTNLIGPGTKRKTSSVHSSRTHAQEFLQGEMLLADAGLGDSLLQATMPEPSPMEGMEWIKWCALQLDMPAWWWELKEVPG